MIRKFYFIFAIVLTFTACDVLDVEPLDKIPAEDALSTPKGIEASLNGIYDQLQSASFAQDAVIFADLAADNLIHIGTKKEYRQVSENRISPENAYFSGLWNSCYDGINRINNILSEIDNVQGFTTEDFNRVKGSCLFLRALNYSTLTKYFGGVPYKTQPTKGISDNELFIERSSETVVYTNIINDLKEAENLFAETGKGNPVYVSEGAIKALLARVYLYQKDWANASLKAKEVIEMGYALAAGNSYATIFDESTSSAEIIFQIDFTGDESVNGMADWFLPDGRFELAAWNNAERTASIAEEFADNDKRKAATIGIFNSPTGDEFYGAKYVDIVNDKDNIIVFRLAEMYLIRAEALNEIAYIADDEAFTMLNTIRLRAGISTYNSSNLVSQQAFREAVEKERRLELAFEGHRFFDLRRTNRMTTVLPAIGTLTTDCKGYFPIPQSELDLNSKMTPNEGY